LSCVSAQKPRGLKCFHFFLFWMVPVPSFAIAKIVQWLQEGSAIAIQLLFSGAGVPASRDGVLVTIPELTIEIAKECSSIRSSLMFLLTTMVLEHLLLKSIRREALIIAIALPLSIAKNGLRIFTIAMLGTHVDAGYLNGRLDRQGDVIFFAISLLEVGALLWILRTKEYGSPNADQRSLQFQTSRSLEN
jgi:exosortase